jgi:hypothetical protein
MQPEWLRRYFHQHDDQCEHQVDENGVSRRDFVRTGFVAGVAAGMAAGSVVAQTGQAEAQIGGRHRGAPTMSAARTTA